MAGCYLVCAIFVCLNIFVVEGIHVKGLYCQDPDTRKLYPINSTWPSESFCGNYTCKIRQKNVTQTEYEPVTKVNISTLENKFEENKTLTSDMETSPSEQDFAVIKKNQPTKEPAFHKEAINIINAIKDEYKNGSTDTDRYLTESEIKSITEILHTVKKSDLEAIVEIYNIAQDIYKEIDKNEDELLVKDTITTTNLLPTITTTKPKETTIVNKKLISNPKESVSYWYEPLHQVSAKVKPSDLKVEETNPIPTGKNYAHPATYFKGPLTEKDFRTLPYYYPLSNFQRMSSYVHKPQNVQNTPRTGKPCNKKFDEITPTWLNRLTNNLKPEPAKPQMMQPMLLPYPYSYVHHYNFSRYPASFYYNYYPWAQLEPYNGLQNYPQHYYGAFIAQDSNSAVAANVKDAKEKSDISKINIEEYNSVNKKAEKLPDWQTKELSAEVLEEVKANILEDSRLLKPLNIPKNIKLEKVGKVIKLDELTRAKREANDIDSKDKESEIIQYEPYIDKTTCESSTELGFFRMGNLSEPYPACCPQKIS